MSSPPLQVRPRCDLREPAFSARITRYAPFYSLPLTGVAEGGLDELNPIHTTLKFSWGLKKWALTRSSQKDDRLRLEWCDFRGGREQV